MAPLNSLGTWAVRSSGGRRRPKSRCFFIGEGPNTEFWYLSGLAERLARMDVPELIELRTVERTGDEKGQSAPVKLLEHALAVREDAEGRFGFDPDADSVSSSSTRTSTRTTRRATCACSSASRAWPTSP